VPRVLSTSIRMPTSKARLISTITDAARLQVRRRHARLRNAKLANLLTVYEFARRLPDVQITINAVHPECCHQHLPFEDAIGFVRLLKPLWVSPNASFKRRNRAPLRLCILPARRGSALRAEVL